MNSESQVVTKQTQQILLLWQLDLLSSDDVADWLNTRVLELESLGHLPDWFFTLIERGPDRCLQMSSREFDFPWLPRDFHLKFCARLHRTNLRAPKELEAFTHWIISASHGEDVDDPAVALGNSLEHLAVECDRLDLALAEARARLPAFIGDAKARVATLFSGTGLQVR